MDVHISHGAPFFFGAAAITHGAPERGWATNTPLHVAHQYTTLFWCATAKRGRLV
jgi:hypothetical protein